MGGYKELSGRKKKINFILRTGVQMQTGTCMLCGPAQAEVVSREYKKQGTPKLRECGGPSPTLG